MANEGRKNKEMTQAVQELTSQVHKLHENSEQAAIFQTANQRLKTDIDALTKEYLRLLALLQNQKLADPSPLPSSDHDHDEAIVNANDDAEQEHYADITEKYKRICQDMAASRDPTLVELVTSAMKADRISNQSTKAMHTIAIHGLELLQRLVHHYITRPKESEQPNVRETKEPSSTRSLKDDDALVHERGSAHTLDRVVSLTEAECQTVPCFTLTSKRTRL
jgi:hypothetical protein